MLILYAVFVDVGSRYEVKYTSGISHFLSKLAFQVTFLRVGFTMQVTKELDMSATDFNFHSVNGKILFRNLILYFNVKQRF